MANFTKIQYIIKNFQFRIKIIDMFKEKIILFETFYYFLGF